MNILLVAAAFGASSGEACSARDPHTGAGLINAERRWVSALEHKDAGSLECVLAPDFTDTQWTGELVSKAEVLGALPQRSGGTINLTDLKVRIHSAMGLVTGVNTKLGPDGKLVAAIRFTDVFLYTSGGWRAVSAQETLVRRPDGS